MRGISWDLASERCARLGCVMQPAQCGLCDAAFVMWASARDNAQGMENLIKA